MSDKVIDVHLGFMDEEVNTVLNGLRDKEMQEKVAMHRPAGHDDRTQPCRSAQDRYRGDQIRRRATGRPSRRGRQLESVLARAISVFLQQDNADEEPLRHTNIGVLHAFYRNRHRPLKECADLPASSGGVFAHAPAAEVLAALAEAATLTLHRWVTIALQARSAGVLH